MSEYIPIPAVAAGTWQSGVAAEASLPASGNNLYDVRAALSEEALYLWTGSAWVSVGGGGGGGVTTVGAFSGSAQTNGGSISGSTITFGPASATVPGMVSTGTQIWAGAKQFNGVVTLSSGAVGAPSIGFSADSGTSGLYRISANRTGFSANGVLVGDWNSTGQWGLGDASGTTSVLTVGGTLLPSAASSMNGVKLSVTYPLLATNGTGYSASLTSAASSSLGIMQAYQVGTMVKGAGGTITRAVNFIAPPQTVGTNNAFMADGSSWTGDWFINQAGTEQSTFGGVINSVGVSMGTTTDAVANTLRFGSTGTWVGNEVSQAGYLRLSAGTGGRIVGYINTKNTFEFDTSRALFYHETMNTQYRVQTVAGDALASYLVSVGGTIYTDITPVANVGAGEDNLISKTIDGKTMATNGDHVTFEAWGTFAANGNTKRIKAYFGATMIFDSGAIAQNGGSWAVSGRIVRTGATTQIASVTAQSSDTVWTVRAYSSSPAETLSSNSTLKLTGEATSDNDIVQTAMMVYYYPRG